MGTYCFNVKSSKDNKCCSSKKKKLLNISSSNIEQNDLEFKSVYQPNKNVIL